MMWELKLKSIVMLTNVIEGASRMVIVFFVTDVLYLSRCRQNAINIGLILVKR